MRAVVFTTDAIFSLIIASVAISILLYFSYYPPAPYLSAYADVQGISKTLMSANIGELATGNPTAYNITYQGAASTDTWNEYQKNNANSGATGYGPLSSSISFIFPTNSTINSKIFVNHGNIYFASGNTIYALNATYGSKVWQRNFPTSTPGYLILYNNMLFTTNTTSSSSYLTSLNAYNGETVWSVPTTSYGSPTTPDIEYNGYIIYGTNNDYVVGFYATNGTFAWESPGLGASPSYVSVVNGSIATVVSGTLALISLNGNSASEPWHTSSSPPSTNPSSYSNLILFGSSTSACGWSINGNPDFCTNLGATVYGVANNGQFSVFQTSNSISEVSFSNTILWSKTVPYTGAIAQPVMSRSNIYSIWDGNYLISQNISTGDVSWYTQVPANYGGVSRITLGYGRLYLVAGGNVISYGSCSVNPEYPVLTAASSLYVNNLGGCATALIDSIKSMRNYSVYINNTLAPAMHVATFDGSNSFLSQGSGFKWMNSQSQSFTMNVWVYPTSQNGVILDELGQQTPNTTWHDSWIDLVNGSVNVSVWNLKCVNIGKIPLNQWSDIALVGSYSNNVLNYSGYINGNFGGGSDGARSIPGGNSSMYYDLGVGDVTNCGSGSYFKGQMANFQIYNTNLSHYQITQLYDGGIQGAPLQNSGSVAWYPLTGDSNDYAGNSTYYPVNVSYAPALYSPTGLSNSYEISKSSIVLPSTSYVASLNNRTSDSLLAQNRYISIPANPVLEPSKFSIGLWFYESSYSMCYTGIGVNNQAFTQGYNLLLPCVNDHSGGITVGNGVEVYDTFSSPSLGKWHYAVATFDGSTITTYIDGVKENTASQSGVTYSSISWLLVAPTVPSGSNESIANIQIYNESLSYQQISSLYKEGIEGNPIQNGHLVGWWPLNGNANDYSGYLDNGFDYSSVSYKPITSLYNVGVYSWK
jgi:hypothetical protein